MLRKLAGPKLSAECTRLSETADGVKLSTGCARATAGHNLGVKQIIHTLAPQYQEHGNCRQQLQSAYEACLELAVSHGVQTLGMPAVGCGIFGWPAPLGAEVALDAVERVIGQK